jgi:Protein of unknown function (DUF2905)
MGDLGKVLIAVGGLLIIFGALLLIGGRLHLPIGKLPGDIVYRGKHSTFYFPIVTSILLSVVLSLVFWLFGRIGR